MFSKIVVFLLLKQRTYGCKRENIVASHVAALPVEVLGFDNRLVTHSKLRALRGVLNMHEYIYIFSKHWVEIRETIICVQDAESDMGTFY